MGASQGRATASFHGYRDGTSAVVQQNILIEKAFCRDSCRMCGWYRQGASHRYRIEASVSRYVSNVTQCIDKHSNRNYIFLTVSLVSNRVAVMQQEKFGIVSRQ